LSRDDMHRLARLGAMRRLEELRREEAMIRASFPELFDDRAPRPSRGVRGAATDSRAAKSTAGPKPAARKRRVSAAARKAVSDRMKKYWAERRKAKAKG
jgi:hypothetical protein